MLMRKENFVPKYQTMKFCVLQLLFTAVSTHNRRCSSHTTLRGKVFTLIRLVWILLDSPHQLKSVTKLRADTSAFSQISGIDSSDEFIVASSSWRFEPYSNAMFAMFQMPKRFRLVN